MRHETKLRNLSLSRIAFSIKAPTDVNYNFCMTHILELNKTTIEGKRKSQNLNVC